MHIKYLIETVNISTLGQDDIEDVRMILQMHLARVNKVIEVIHEQVQQQRDDNNRFMMGL